MVPLWLLQAGVLWGQMPCKYCMHSSSRVPSKVLQTCSSHCSTRLHETYVADQEEIWKYTFPLWNIWVMSITEDEKIPYGSELTHLRHTRPLWKPFSESFTAGAWISIGTTQIFVLRSCLLEHVSFFMKFWTEMFQKQVDTDYNQSFVISIFGLH